MNFYAIVGGGGGSHYLGQSYESLLSIEPICFTARDALQVVLANALMLHP